MIEIDNLSLHVGQTKAIDNVTATFTAGRMHALIGPNGAGKTSLFKALCGLVKPSSGVVRLDGRDLSQLSLAERANVIGYLPQERSIAWDLKAVDIAALGAHGLAPDMAKARAVQELKGVGLADRIEAHVFTLSGGQRARVLLARLLATDAAIYCLDEPLTALDPAWQRRVLQILKGRAAQGRTIIVSLHDIGLAAQFADQLWVLHQGRLMAHGTPEEALSAEVLSHVFGVSGAFSRANETLHLRLDAQALPG